VSFENHLKSTVYDEVMPANVKPYITSLAFKKVMDWVIDPSKMFGSDAINKRNALVTEAFKNGVDDLNERLGADMSQWQYGQANNKHITMNHALGNSGEAGAKLNLGPLPRGGNAYTPGSTGGNRNQSSGASFRMIVNTGDWDAAVGTNSPGQSGNPASPFYSNLFESWAKDQYFPVYYSRQKIEQNLNNKTTLIPNK
jgi:penicillin amidase